MAVCGVVPVATIVPLFPAGRYWQIPALWREGSLLHNLLGLGQDRVCSGETVKPRHVLYIAPFNLLIVYHQCLHR